MVSHLKYFSSSILLFLINFFIILILNGCSLPGQELTPTPDINTQYTEAAKTVIAQITDIALSETSIPHSTFSPTADFSFTETATSTQQASPTLAKSPTPSFGISPLPNYRIIFKDDFSVQFGWYTDEGINYGYRYTESGYLIYVNILAATIWTIKDIELVDSRIETIAQQISGPENGYYGVSCRHQDGDNYYALVISSDGSYAIIRYYLGEKEFISEGTTPPGTIYPDRPNTITADCIGNSLTLYANNTPLASITDDVISSGVFGLVAGTRNTEGFEAEFLEINVQAP